MIGWPQKGLKQYIFLCPNSYSFVALTQNNKPVFFWKLQKSPKKIDMVKIENHSTKKN